MSLIRGLRSGAAATLAACALTAATALLPAAPAGVVTSSAKARPHGPHGGGGGGATGWEVLAPVSYKNLTLFPVRGRDLAPGGNYLTLDEGIKNGTVVITERGAGAVASRRTRRGSNAPARQQVSTNAGDNSSVNELALINRSGKKLLLLAGEVIVGGKQDRIVQEDRIVPPVSIPISLSVFCVEHGRWSQRASATDSAAPVVAPVTEPRKAENFYGLGAISHPKLRAAAQDKKEQGEVWKEVSSNNVKLGTSNSTDTYQEVYANKKVAAQMGDYIRVLEKEVLQPGVVGVVVARNGEPVWVDAFANHALFARYWPKLLKSYVVDAMGDFVSEKRPNVEQARRYLAEREGTVSIAGQAGVYQLLKTEHTDYAVFDLRDISLPAPLRLHLNKMDR